MARRRTKEWVCGRPHLRIWRASVAAALSLATLAAACASDDEAGPSPRYQAEIVWTTGGIPHITGKTFGDAGFGSGYAFATQNACLLADQLLKVNSRRAATFGPGEEDAHVESDFFQLLLGVRSAAEAHWADVHPDVQALLEGYAAGFNHRLKEVGAAGLPERCRGAAWVQPITALDLFTYVMDLALVASLRALPSLGPVNLYPTPPKQTTHFDPAVGLGRSLRREAPQPKKAIGSNGIALGKDKSATGHGMVLGNPHFPWAGELRFWQLHVTVPGKYDVAGAGLSGSPIPNIGFNRDLAWTHTVSKSMKFTAYRLKLVAGQPTAYHYGGEKRQMTTSTLKVEVRKEDGSLETRSRVTYRSHFGPVIAISGGIAEWTPESVFTVRDANAGNHGLLEHFLRVGQARSVAELEQVMQTVQANPWVNTIAADRGGNAFYSESNSVPNLSPATYAAHKAAIAGGDGLAELLANYGVFLLDGSDPSQEWLVEAGSREPGLVPYQKTPHATRSDYLANANESYWLSNVAAPLPEAQAMFGDRGAVRSLRTRVVLHEIVDSGPGSAGGQDGKFSLEELASIPFRNRVLSADLGLGAARTFCETTKVVKSGAKDIDLTAACAALAAWDGRDSVDSRGAIVWRETLAATAGLTEHLVWNDVFSVPFDPAQPLTTPNTVSFFAADGKPGKLAQALAKAVLRLQQVGIPPDARLGDWQFLPSGADRLQVPGGMGAIGNFNIAGYAPGRDSSTFPTIAQGKVVHPATDLTEQGYVVNYGSSYMMAVTFDDKGPIGRQLLTYSQSGEPDSPHWRDQTLRYGKGEWLDIAFHPTEIAAARLGALQKIAHHD